jgi:hypothetical protein
MKIIVSIFILSTVILGASSAQNTEELVGKWYFRMDDNSSAGEYEIFKNEDKLQVKSVYYIDEKGKTVPNDELIISDLKMKGQRGSATYKANYEGKLYKTKCKFLVKSKNEMHVTYWFMGYKFTEIWTRKK